MSMTKVSKDCSNPRKQQPPDELLTTANMELDDMKHALSENRSLTTFAPIAYEQYHQEADSLMSTSPYNLCWKDLFDRAYVASYSLPFSSSVTLDHYGTGLRIPFDLLTAMAGIENWILRDGGLILTGFSTALIPVRVIKDKSIQWHLIEFNTIINSAQYIIVKSSGI